MQRRRTDFKRKKNGRGQDGQLSEREIYLLAGCQVLLNLDEVPRDPPNLYATENIPNRPRGPHLMLFWRYFDHSTRDREYSRYSRSRIPSNKFKMAVKQNLLPPGTDLFRMCLWMTTEKLRLSRYSCLGGTTGTTFITLIYSKQYSTNQVFIVCSYQFQVLSIFLQTVLLPRASSVVR